MLGPLDFVPVREIDYEAELPQPLGFHKCNELVDDALSVVGEAAELRLHMPGQMAPRASGKVEHAKLGKTCVGNDKRTLVFTEMLWWDVNVITSTLSPKRMEDTQRAEVGFVNACANTTPVATSLLALIVFVMIPLFEQVTFDLCVSWCTACRCIKVLCSTSWSDTRT
ncbi:hypothetical protein K470DRAFT_259190 [Piedraia hortae CBS 480.64]|uniref:Uncharacterized protein n=1 Tax=Piedraia hortae CBS 480.64 TaxID=1314780 RepID=A0A6A7BXD8_9PEZI|nr:hypothetical protein K470DRAFT_259190 [Piedraia hortae CBS 480.64]